MAEDKKNRTDATIYIGFDAEYKRVGDRNIVLSQQFYGIAGEATWEGIVYIDEAAESDATDC